MRATQAPAAACDLPDRTHVGPAAAEQVIEGGLHVGTHVAVTVGPAAVLRGVGPFVKFVARSSNKYQRAVGEAQRLYPDKAGRIERHHIAPKYLGGAADGTSIELDAAYHQLITNEFRAKWPYGTGQVPSADELKRIMTEVYQKYPLPE